MLWFSKNYDCRVIGSDCSALCCEDFFRENNMTGYKAEKIGVGKSGTPIVKHTSSISKIELF
jgi:hypothetical protein